MTVESLSFLTNIPSRWELIEAAQAGETEAARAARQKLCARYDRAVRRYLKRKLDKWLRFMQKRQKEAKREAVVDELASNFAYAVLRCERILKSAARHQGKFRHYLQRVLGNWVIDYFRREKTKGDREIPLDVDLGNDRSEPVVVPLAPEPELSAPAGSPEPVESPHTGENAEKPVENALAAALVEREQREAMEKQYQELVALPLADLLQRLHGNGLILWRAELLRRTLEALAAREAEGGPPHHTLLRLKEEDPELGGQALADAVSARLGRTITAVNIRAITSRAREHYAELLVAELARSLEPVLGRPLDAATLREKLAEMKLVNVYVNKVLAKYDAE